MEGVSCVEFQKVYEALEDPDWVEAMHEELDECNFKNIYLTFLHQ
jgi:hypothetical protein